MKKDKREIIIEAMEQLMEVMPYGEISVDAVAKQAGIGKGSIYYYFKSKDDILYSLIEQSYRRAIREYFDIMRSKTGAAALEKIKDLFQSIIKEDFRGIEKNLLRTLNLNEDLLLHSRMKYIAVREISPVLAELFMQGIREGSIKTDTPKESAELIVAVLTFFLDDTFFTQNKEEVVNKLKILANVLETCLRTEKGSFDFLYMSKYSDLF